MSEAVVNETTTLPRLRRPAPKSMTVTLRHLAGGQWHVRADCMGTAAELVGYGLNGLTTRAIEAWWLQFDQIALREGTKGRRTYASGLQTQHGGRRASGRHQSKGVAGVPRQTHCGASATGGARDAAAAEG